MSHFGHILKPKAESQIHEVANEKPSRAENCAGNSDLPHKVCTWFVKTKCTPTPAAGAVSSGGDKQNDAAFQRKKERSSPP